MSFPAIENVPAAAAFGFVMRIWIQEAERKIPKSSICGNRGTATTKNHFTAKYAKDAKEKQGRFTTEDTEIHGGELKPKFQTY